MLIMHKKTAAAKIAKPNEDKNLWLKKIAASAGMIAMVIGVMKVKNLKDFVKNSNSQALSQAVMLLKQFTPQQLSEGSSPQTTQQNFANLLHEIISVF